MRVALFVKFIGRNGGAWLTDDLAVVLAEEGCTVDLFLLGKADPDFQHLHPQIRVREFTVPSRSAFSKPRWAWQAITSYFKLLLTASLLMRTRKYDRIVGFSAFFPFFPLMRLTKWNARSATTVGFLWDFYPIQWEESGVMASAKVSRLIHWFERSELDGLDHIVVMTPANAEYLERYHPGLGAEVEIGYLWRDSSALSAACASENFVQPEGEQIVFGGSLTAGRDLGWIVEFAEELADVRPTANVVVVGDGPGRQDLLRLIKEREISGLRSIGALPLGSYLNLLKTSDVGLIVTSGDVKSPSLPSKCLEYMWAQLPILAVANEFSDLGTIVEQTFRCGSAADFGSPAEAARSACQLLDDKATGNQLGIEGGRVLKELLSPEVAATRVLRR